MRKGPIIALLLAFGMAAQQPAEVLSGSWTASAGPKQVYRGRWSGQRLPDKPNAALGSWVVVNDANETVQQGTWAAEKSAQGWRGQWSARVATGRDSTGTVISGTWQSAADSKGTTLADLLRRTLEEQVAGSWRSGQLAGYWWLKGSAAK